MKRRDFIIKVLLFVGLFVSLFSLLFSIYVPADKLLFIAHHISADGSCESCTLSQFTFLHIILISGSIVFSALFLLLQFGFIRKNIVSQYTLLLSYLQQLSFQQKVIILFLVGVALRVGLFLSSSPEMMYDDYLSPVVYVSTNHTLPSLSTCYECFQPPLYFLFGGEIYSTFSLFGIGIAVKSLQFFSLFCSLATLFLGLKILKMIFSQTSAFFAGFSFLVFFPSEIYLSTMISNSALTQLLVSLSLYLLLTFLRKPTLYLALFVGVITGIALITKPLSLILIPLLLFMIIQKISLEKRTALLLVFVLIIAGSISMLEYGKNYYLYHTLWPHNTEYFPLHQEPGFEGVSSFLTFRFFDILSYPIIHPSTYTSFWTNIYASMWYDYFPVYIRFASVNYLFGPLLFLLGIVPTILIINGSIRLFQSKTERLFSVTLLLSILLVGVACILLPYYSSMKASYLLPAVIPFSVCFAEGYRSLKKSWPLILYFIISFYVAVTAHFLVLFFTL